MQNDEAKLKCMNDLHQSLMYKLRPCDKIHNEKWNTHDNKPKLKMHE
jgi:hypothetical protein